MKIKSRFKLQIIITIVCFIVLYITAVSRMSKMVSANNDLLPDQAHNVIILGIVGLIIIAIIIVTAVITYKSIVRPIDELSDAVSAVSKGDFSKRITYDNDNELGAIAGYFKQTSSRIHEYSEYIDEISAILNEIAKGNLEFSVKRSFDGEFAKVKKGFDNVSKSLNGTMSRIYNCSDNILTTAQQMSANLDTLSQSASQQSNSTDQFASSLNDIFSRISTTAQYASDAREAANMVDSEMTAGNSQMQHMMSAMNDISTASGEIEKIIKTIEDIAFQTNILALNAAVEAARAGSAGKGFAVVADEVRNLATKSAEAAKVTTSLIKTSLEAVSNGTQIANNTAQALEGMVIHSKKVISLVNNISEDMDTQTVGVNQINESVSQISSVIQMNSTTSHESADYGQQLLTQAQNLKEHVSKFNIGKEHLKSASIRSTDTESRDTSFGFDSSYGSDDSFDSFSPAVTSSVSDYTPKYSFVKAENPETPDSFKQTTARPAASSSSSSRSKVKSSGSSLPTSPGTAASAVDDEYTPDDRDSKY